MNRDNIKGIQMWRDDEVEDYPDGTKNLRERYFIRTQCMTHSESDPNSRYAVPAVVILEATPYRQSVHLNCIEVRRMHEYGEPITCKNTQCPFYNEELEMNQTNYYEVGITWLKEQWAKKESGGK